jgi:hypothetical protein
MGELFQAKKRTLAHDRIQAPALGSALVLLVGPLCSYPLFERRQSDGIDGREVPGGTAGSQAPEGRWWTTALGATERRSPVALAYLSEQNKGQPINLSRFLRIAIG